MHLKDVLFKTRALQSNVKVGWIAGVATAEDLGPLKDKLFPSSTYFEYLDAAAAGDKDALYSLGSMYETGALFLENLTSSTVINIPKNPETARAIFELAEEKNHAESSYRLGLMAHHGAVETADQTIATKHFQTGAAAGHAICCRMLGIYCVQRNEIELASKWFMLGAKLQDPICCFNVATGMLSNGYREGSKQEALAFAKIAADQIPNDQGLRDLIQKIAASSN